MSGAFVALSFIRPYEMIYKDRSVKIKMFVETMFQICCAGILKRIDELKVTQRAARNSGYFVLK